MFGIDGIEFLIILIVLVVVVGPKDLPKMMRAFGQATTRMRKTAAEFRRHFDEAMREAELDDVADTLKGAKTLNPRKKLTEIFDPLREVTSDIQSSLREQVAGEKPAESKGDVSKEENISSTIMPETVRKTKQEKTAPGELTGEKPLPRADSSKADKSASHKKRRRKGEAKLSENAGDMKR